MCQAGEGEWVESEGENGLGLTMEVENEAEICFMSEDHSSSGTRPSVRVESVQ